MNEYRKRVAALKVGDPVVVRSGTGKQWLLASVTTIANRLNSDGLYLLGHFIEAGGMAFNEYGSVLLNGSKTSGSRCIVPLDMWKTGAWKQGAIPAAPKVPQSCVDCTGAKDSAFSPRCKRCRSAHAAKKKIEYKQNRQARDARQKRWELEQLPAEMLP